MTKTILVVDDKDSVRTLLRDFLTAQQFRVATATNGREALRESNVEITPDVVIRAIRAASDWTLDGDYSLQPTTAPISIPLPPPKPPAGDKK